LDISRFDDKVSGTELKVTLAGGDRRLPELFDIAPRRVFTFCERIKIRASSDMTADTALRILVITSRPLIDSTDQAINLLDVEKERRRVADGLKRAGVAVRVHFLPEATTSAVKNALRDEWDVVHFTGHGTADGRLLLENGFGEAQFLTKEETTKLFTGQQAPLVVLSACHSETIARGLLGANAPSVVAIDARQPIADLAAIIFAEHFYGALSKGWNLQRAFDDAQRAVALDPQVGDANPPRDDNDKAEEAWSERFKLIGDATRTFPVSTGQYEETGARRHAQGNLRERNRNFVGRAAEIADVVTAFDKDRAQRIALYGAGGLGKTELSQAVAWWYVERERVDAVLWSSANRIEDEYLLRDLGSLLSIAGRAFKLPITEQTNFDEQKQAVREFLGARRALVILDNWETIEGRARRELWNFVLSLPDTTRVLVTSRDTLPPKDARNKELDTLAPEDAVKLFLQVARNAEYFDKNPRLGAEETAILSAICDRLSGYPLAIEVVAGQTVSRTLGEIWNDLLRVPKNVLEGKDEITGEPRGVWTSLDLSYNVASADEQAMFRQMGILLIPAAADDIAAITTIETPRPVLDSLVKRSLVQMREGAYALLPIVRLYAESKLADAGQNPQEMHVRAMKHYAQKETLDGALAASGHMLQLATRFGLREAAELFIKYVWEFYHNLITRGYWMEARSKTEELIAVARALGDKQTEAHAIGELAAMFQRIGEYERAVELTQEARKLVEESGDKRGVALALHQLGILVQSRGDYGEAARLYHESMQIKEELGNKKGVAYTLHQLGMLAQDQGNYSEAVEYYRQSLKIKEELADKSGMATTLLALGTLAQDQGSYEEAVRHCQESLKINDERGNKNGIAATLGQLGQLAYMQGHMKAALGYFLKALVIFEQLHAPHRQLARKGIASIRNAVGEEQFAAWVKELSIDDKLTRDLLEQNAAAGDEQGAQEFIEFLTGAAQAVVEARAQGSAEQQAALVQQLTQDEDSMRQQNAAEVADFFAVLRAMLAGEDVTDKIAALVDPLKQIAEQARASLN